MAIRIHPPEPPLSDARRRELERLAREARWHVVRTVAESKAGHVGGPLSAMEILIALFFEVMRIRPTDPKWPDRDRFILSKGHSAIGLYTIMALRGFFDVAELATFDKGDSRLQGHPDATRLPGLETSTGSLGQGLSVGAGMALGARLSNLPFHTWVVLGDGEMQEGMVWESVQIASRYQLGNLTALVDLNGLQQFGWPMSIGQSGRSDRADPWPEGQLATALEAFGWKIVSVDGHDLDELIGACNASRDAVAPTAILARTVKGKGLSFAEGRHAWHTGVATADELERARVELEDPPEGTA